MTAALPLVLTLACVASPPFPDPGLVERLGERRPGVNYREEDVPPYELPAVLAGADAGGWPDRRAELVRSLGRHVYGVCPPPPGAVEFVVENAERVGAADWREVTAHCNLGDGRRFSFPFQIVRPADAAGAAPVVALIVHPGRIEQLGSRTGDSEFFPWRAILDAGFAAAVVPAAGLAPDDAAAFDANLLAAAGMGGDRPATGCGALAAWGWGVSRVVDYCERTPDLDAARVAVAGHSRGGKAALWAAARDPRIAVAYSNDSGCGGAALSRRRLGETVEIITGHFPHWFAPNFAAFAGREDELPVDQHQLIAAIAPRAVYVASASEDLWADPRGEFLALAAANPAFALFGDGPLDPDDFPAVGEQVVRGRRGYHLRAGGHDLTREDWGRFLSFAAGVWDGE